MSAASHIALKPVDSIEITTLVDNGADMLLAGRDEVKRPGWYAGARVEAPLLLDPSLPRFLAAEHGFAALVTITKDGRSRRLMYDAGLSVDGLVHNLDVLQIDFADIEAIVFSHGHFDHVGGLNGLLRRFGARRMPLLLHPDFWLERRIAVPNAEAFNMPTASRSVIEGAGFAIVEGEQPSLLLDGSVLITGEVARTTDFERGFPVHQAKRDGEWTPDPLILDDQALIANVRDKGLVVLTGCGHAGIINIIRYAQALTGETRLHAAIGGFHLSGNIFAPVIAPVVAALKDLAPALVVPGHCTGFAALRAIADALPDACAINSVGTRYVL